MMVMIVMTVLAHLMAVPGIVIVDVSQRTTQVMIVMTVLVYQMVITLKIIAAHVMLIALTTVCRIVLVVGVELP